MFHLNVSRASIKVYKHGHLVHALSSSTVLSSPHEVKYDFLHNYIINELPMGSRVGKQTCLHKGWVPDLLIHQKRTCSGTMHPKVTMDTFDEKMYI